MKKTVLFIALLVVFACEEEQEKDCAGIEGGNNVCGCTDSISTNYDSTATQDDGSCLDCAGIEGGNNVCGCTDSTASTYDSQGNLAEKHDYYAAGRLKRKAVYHRDYRGALITLITYDYAADSTLAGRIDVHYNNRGNPHEVVAYGSNGKSQHKEMFTYRYDAFGNWVTQTAKRQVVTKNAAYFEPTRILMRVFEYYERE